MIQRLQALKALARALTRFIRKRQGAECWRITWAPSSFPLFSKQASEWGSIDQRARYTWSSPENRLFFHMG